MRDNDELNLRRVAAYPELRLRDAVARHLNTHPFDSRVTALSYMQMLVLLELRHPSDPAEAEKAALQKDTDDSEARDQYHLGDVEVKEDTIDDALAFATYAQ